MEFADIAAALRCDHVCPFVKIPTEQAAARTLGSFGKLAAQTGLTVVLEWFRYSSMKTLDAAVDLIRLAGEPNIQLNVDILHLMRNGGRPADLAGVDASLLRYAQISDGPPDQPESAQGDEASFNRNFPREGEFPLVSFVRRLPRDAVLSIEAPRLER